MKLKTVLFIFLLLSAALLKTTSLHAQYWTKDTLKTSNGDFIIQVIGNNFLHFSYRNIEIYVDPIPHMGDISHLPKADLILITHSHRDHLSPETIRQLSTPTTCLIASKSCMSKIPRATFLKNGEQLTFKGIYIKAVPAYNIKNLRPDGIPYHVKGEGNGYFLIAGDKSIYVAGDTEYIPEMRHFMHPDVAFIPMMMPFIMNEDMFVRVVRQLRPHIVYPVHYNTSLNGLVQKLQSIPGLEIRIR